MAEFKVIETQEELDKVIGERIKRAEAAAEKKFSDYADLKTKNEEYAKQLSELTEQLKQQKETIGAHDATVAELNDKLHQYEMSSVKTQIALEYGIPYQMSSRLTGDDEAAIRADAESMVKLIGATNQPAPLGNAGPPASKSAREQFADFASALFND